MFKLLKAGLVLNGVCLTYGIINSKLNIRSVNTHKKFDFVTFEKHLKDFQQNSDYKPVSQNLQRTRDEDIKVLNNERFDILIIGGGCSGAGVLLEGYLKGLKCALIEANDFASGTSSRSTKLIHGGIRYLQEAFNFPPDGSAVDKFKLVFEALRERDFVINSAPFMNSIVEIKIPAKNFFLMDYYFCGVMLYHFLYAIQNFPNMFYTYPGPKIYLKDKFVSFFEGQMFDSRQALLTILTTRIKDYVSGCQASIPVNYVEHRGYIYDENNKIIGVKAYDKIKEKEFTINAQVVVNATGIYGDENFGKNDKLANKLITASKGSHLVLDKNVLGLDSGYMIPRTTDGRVLFILPYFNNTRWLIGTTDTELEKSKSPFIEDADVSYIKGELKAYFTNLSEKDLEDSISSKWAGYRPLVSEPNHDHVTKSLARNHIIRFDEETGLYSLLGGKWTTYRQMGVDTIDKIVKTNKTISDKPLLDNKSDFLKLTGGYHHANVEKANITYNEELDFYDDLKLYLSQKYLIGTSLIGPLIFKYGLNVIKILDLYNDKNNKETYNNLLNSEVIYTTNYEMAVKPNDFICRRSGLAFIDLKQAEAGVDNIADIMSKRLNWSKSQLQKIVTESKESLRFMI